MYPSSARINEEQASKLHQLITDMETGVWTSKITSNNVQNFFLYFKNLVIFFILTLNMTVFLSIQIKEIIIIGKITHFSKAGK